MKKIICSAFILSVFSSSLFAQKNNDTEVYDVDVSGFTVDDVDRTDEVARAQYIFDYENGIDELYLYGADGALLEHMTLTDFTIDSQDYDYEELRFSSVKTEKLSVRPGEKLKAYAEYDWSKNGYVYWEIFGEKDDAARIEIEFWSDSMAVNDDDYYDYDDYEYEDDDEEYHSEAVEVLTFKVDGVDRTTDVRSAEYRYSYDSETEELYLYGGGGALITRITVSDFELESQDDNYEELYFYSVDVEKLPLSDSEELEAYAEYDWDEEYVRWEIYTADTGRTRIEVTFW